MQEQIIRDEKSTTGQKTLLYVHVSEKTAIVSQVLQRIDVRQQLQEMAKEILDGLNHTQRFGDISFVGEMDTGYYCHPDPQHPNDTHNFLCSGEDFDCGNYGGNFNCDAPPAQNSYSDCGYFQYECETNFDCSADVFFCHDFVCDETYGCNETYDFGCVLEFDCQDGIAFNCTAGHGFFCDTDHECCDSFSCNSSGNPHCTNDYSVDGGDTTAGDFLCGDTIGTNNDFDCTDDFDCTSADDFRCIANSDFDCGGGLPGTDTFDCGSTTANTDFDCKETFDCPDAFTCHGDYDCNTEYECKDEFNCSQGGANPDFQCSPNQFTCSGDYTEPPCQFTCGMEYSEPPPE